MQTFYEYIHRIDEDLLRHIRLVDAIAKSGVPEMMFRQAYKVMSINDFLENPPHEAFGAYALGLSEVEGLEVYFHIAKVFHMIDWPKAYEDSFGPEWERETSSPDVTDRFLNKILQNNKMIVFFIPNDAMRGGKYGRYTREEAEFFFRNPQHLSKVIFVLGTYDFIDRENYKKLVRMDGPKYRSQADQDDLLRNVLRNPTQHRYPERPDQSGQPGSGQPEQPGRAS